jgi:hypothetical protein
MYQILINRSLFGFMGYIKVLGLVIATLIMFYGCAKDEADCGGVINSGTLTGPITSNCANNNNNSGGGTGGGAGTTDRHDSTVTTTTTAPGG